MIGRVNTGGGTGGTLTITAPANVTVTVSKDGKTKAKNSGTSGVVVFKGLEAGTWTVTISGDGKTAQKTVTITTDYSTTIAFFAATITITYPAGSTCTCSDGTTTLTAPDTSGMWACTVPNAGTWTVSSTDDDKSKSGDIVITTDGQIESIDLKYRLDLYNNGETQYAWTGDGTDTATELIMDTPHKLFNNSYGDYGCKYLADPISFPSGYSKLSIRYYCTGTAQTEGSPNRAFCVRSTYSGTARYSSDGVVASVSIGFYTSETVKVIDISSIEAGRSLYVGTFYNSNKNISNYKKYHIKEIWFE